MLALERYLRALASLLPAPVRAVASPVVDRLLAIWTWSRSLARRARTGLIPMALATRDARDKIIDLASQAHATLWWTRHVMVPGAVGHATDGVTRWVGERLRAIGSDIGAVRSWVAGLVSASLALALDALADLRDWARGRLDTLAAIVDGTAERVWRLWGTPERLAAWLVGAMWTALWRHASDQLETIAEAIWARRQRLILRGLAEAERLIGRLL